ncbi:MAG: ATP-dependent helicase [Desulfobacteraceae bacterium]|nr:ATP-dependent helicase [Desulfobacteraceae bacterium]
MEFTKEQETIFACDLRPDEILKVKAFAGTGKTTTLVEYARQRPDMRFLYVAFNKSVQMEASKKFGSNVVCKTSHALAFRSKGAKHAKRLVPSFKANTVKEVLNLKSFEDAKFTIDTLQNYLVSADPKVNNRHIPFTAKIYYESSRIPMPDFVKMGNDLGRLMCTGENRQIGMLHDGYLKLYQLSNPRLNFDCILLDESQDINPVTAAFVLFQPGVSKILVGDPHQQIYSFRGAKNSMDMVKAQHSMFLTTSFRFNNSIARVANMVLRHFKDETKKIRGLREKNGNKDFPQITTIARTNGRIFDEAVSQLRNRKKIGFVGGIAGYRFNRILDAYYLYINDKYKIADPYIRSFETFAAMGKYAETVEDHEITSICKVVQNYRHEIPHLINEIKNKAVDVEKADVILTTAHKSKGLEWPVVRLTDDFPDLVVDGAFVNKDEMEADEFNLIYVSMTRAMDKLKFDPQCSVIEFIEKAKGLN